MLIGARGRRRRATTSRPGERAALLGIRARPEPVAALIGLEHEFRVLQDGQPVDFRDLIHTLPIDGLRLDPGDTNAYRCRSGLSITADGAEAEFATPPIDVRPGFAGELSNWAERGRAEIEATLPPGSALEGFSTHLSITMDDAINERVCALFAETFAAGFAMLIEGPRSQGIYIRPRPGRIELCGEFARGPQLEAAATFAVGAVLACATAVRSGQHTGLPPRLIVATLPGVERYGLRIRREAYGVDLYADGRSANLTPTDGGQLSAQEHLEAEWNAARSALRGRSTPSASRHVDDVVARHIPLGIEGAAGSLRATAPPPSRQTALPFSRPEPQAAFALAAATIARPGFTVTPRVLTWDLAVLRLEGARSAFAAIPRAALADFESRLAAGKLDRTIVKALSRPPDGSILLSRAQLSEPAVYDTLGDTSALVAPEREPEGYRVSEDATSRAGKSGRAGKQPAAAPARPGKVTSRRWKLIPLPFPRHIPSPAPSPSTPPAATPPASEPAPPLPPPPRTWLTAATVAAIGVIAIAGAIGVFAVVHKSDDSNAVGSPTATPTHEASAPVSPLPSATPAAAVATETAKPSAATSATETRAPSPTIDAAAATASPKPTDTSGAASTSTPTATATSTSTATSTTRPTETPRPTIAPTATATPTPTNTPIGIGPIPTVVIPTIPIPTVCNGAACK